MTKTIRTDFYFSFDRTTAFKETPEGFLTGNAVVATVGVYPYRQDDGSISWELRPPEEVFKQSNMDSLKGKVITNEHPPELITSENYRDYAVGAIGDSIRRDDYNLIAFLTIQDKEAVDAIKRGKRGLSCGYGVTRVKHDVTYDTVDWDGNPTTKTYPCPGVWNGVPYDAIQTNLEQNHLSIVDRGRAGDAARIRMDGQCIPFDVAISHPHHHEKEGTMKKLTLDNGLAYDVAPEVAVEVESLRSKIVALDAAIAGQKAELTSALDAVRAESTAKDEKIASLEAEKAEEPARLDAAVKARAGLLAIAAKFGVALKGDESDLQIKSAVVRALKPSANLDGESETFVATYFKIAVDEANTDSGNHNDSADIPGAGAREERVDHAAVREAARQKMISGAA